MADWVGDLERLSALRTAGHITDQQFEDAKARVMSGTSAAPPPNVPEPKGLEFGPQLERPAVGNPVPQESAWDLGSDQDAHAYEQHASTGNSVWQKVGFALTILAGVGGIRCATAATARFP